MVKKRTRRRHPFQWLFASTMIIAGVIGSLSFFGREDFTPLPDGVQANRIVADKTNRTLTLYNGTQILRTYAASFGSGGPEAKLRESDNRTPHGTYGIEGRNPRSAYHLSLRISYPNPADIAAAKTRGDKPGSDIMIHGIRNGLGWLGTFHRLIDWTAGCIAVTNQEMEEIWRVVPDGAVIEIS